MYDLGIVGAGPAGMAAACEAREHGLSVVMLDEQARPGGQIWRDVTRAGAASQILGKDYAQGHALAERFLASGCTHLAGASVWSIERDEEVYALSYQQDGGTGEVLARHLLLATGALERPMPIPGWTLPGVMTAGAAQILLKSAGLVSERAVLAGAGPLLYLVAAQMYRAGAAPLALVETSTRGDVAAALRHGAGALRGWATLAKGLGLLRELRDVPRYRGATDLAVLGEDAACGLSFTHRGARHEIAAESVLLHHGVTPNIQASRALGLPHHWDTGQGAFVPETDRKGRAGEALWIAGDGAGIAGAEAAVARGSLVGAHVAQALGKQVRLATLRRHARVLNRALAPRAFLDRAFPPYAEALAPSDNTIICRCEEITAGALRATVAEGARGPNQAKAFCRAGMGACQGRMCGLSATQVLAQATGQSAQDTGYYRLRWPLKPITLGMLAKDVGEKSGSP